MDQKKTGAFLKALRNEKGLTQEKAAEQFGVAGRTVSRWETGSNMPDLGILIEIAEFYDVDIREIIDGERKSEKMNIETKETLQKVAEYVDLENERVFKETFSISAINITLLITSSIICCLEVYKNVLIDGGIKLLLTGFSLLTSIVLLLFIAQLKFGKKTSKISETDVCAYISYIFGIISIPLIFTVAFWMIPAFLSVGVGLLALKNRTEKKRIVIIGILCSVIATLLAILLLVTGYFV